MCSIRLQCRDDFQLDRDRRWERDDFDRGPGRIRLPLSREIFRVKFVIKREILLHVCEEDCHINDVVPARARVFQDKPNILENGPALSFNLVTDNIAIGIQRDPRDFLATPGSRADPGQKQEIADTFRVRKCPNGLRGSGTLDRLAQA